MSEPLKMALETVLANSYALYLKSHNYHWNVCSPHFRDLHLMFEDHYRDLADAVDAIAEQIRIIGYKIPATFDFMKSKSTLKDGDHTLSAMDMVSDLMKDHQTLIQMLNSAIAAARSANDAGTEDLMIERIRVHSKISWMLQSTV